MSTPVKPWKGFLDDGHSEGVWQSSEGAWQSLHAPHPAGHTHFWDRALSRRTFVQTAAGVTGVVIGSQFARPAVVRAGAQAAPKPIPGGTHLPFLNDDEIVHFFFPARGAEPSTITDFRGVVGIGNADGMGTATMDGISSRLAFGADCRFMKGRYVGDDGAQHSGTFGFI